MRAMILAAGRGERLRPITDSIPKPLVKVGGKELLLWHLEKLKDAGIFEVIVNSAWLSDQIKAFLGDGKKFGMSITHSQEPPGGLETLGGIVKALPFFQGETFLVVNGDTFIDVPYTFFTKDIPLSGQALLFLTDNPKHHPQGDFSLDKEQRVVQGHDFTFTGAAVYTPQIFSAMKVQREPLRPLFDRLIEKKSLYGKKLAGNWFDVGTEERLRNTDAYIRAKNLNRSDS